MDYLTVKEVAELKGCKPQYIRKLAKERKLDAVVQQHPQNHKPCYMFQIAALPDDLKAKYYRQKHEASGMMPEKIPEPEPLKKTKVKRILTFEDCTEEQRRTINTWTSILKEWQAQRAGYQSKTQFDKLYVGKCQLEHPELQVSEDILYRKWAAYKENDLAGILGLRGAWNKDTSTIPEPVWQAFLWFWLDENEPPLSGCYRCTINWTEEFYPELLHDIPTERSFRRHIKNDVAKAIKELKRNGEKAFSDRCMPYMMRMYDKLQPNDVWIADNHTLDIQSLDENGEKHRLYLTAFLDAKSGVLVGWNITETVDSQSTILALRHGIKRFGIPKVVYFDNGREFLTHDIGGKGHRKRKSDADEIEPPTILKRLGIEMRNAIVRNAKAKPIERTFRTVKEQFSRMFSGFCGGTILEKPESLKRRIKEGKIPQDYEIRQVLEAWIDGDYNLQAYGGTESKYKNMSRIDVWNKEIRAIRKASDAELNLMLMRSTRKQKIKRNGVYVTICGERIWYMHPEQTIMHLDEEVYVRYDPADLRSVRIYNADDKLLYIWNCADSLLVDYIAEQQQDIADGQQIAHHSKKFVRDMANGLTAGLTNEQKITMLDMTVRKAQAAKSEKFRIKMPTNIIPVRVDEELPEQQKAAAGMERECVVIDLKRMKKNSELRKEQ